MAPFNGNKECKVDYIKNFLEVQSAVLQFRFMTGLRKARTAPQIENLITWTVANNEDMADVAACRRYFDLEMLPRSAGTSCHLNL